MPDGATASRGWRARAKCTEWARRYLPAECIGLLGALVCGLMARSACDSTAVVALAGTWGENFGYYGTMLATEMRGGDTPVRGRPLRRIARAIRNLLLEFGGAECLDSLFLRPTAMYALSLWSGNLVAGIVAGKLVADVGFYIPAIIAYELRRKYLPN
jgi:hypothetical protein